MTSYAALAVPKTPRETLTPHTAGSSVAQTRHGLSRLAISLTRLASPQSTTLRDTAYLDGLRGVAAFMVYVFHMMLRYYPTASAWYGRDPECYQIIRLPFLRNLYLSGQAMVSVFFVVSGFVLTMKPLKLARKRDAAGLYDALASCMFRRWLRLWLPAFASTFIVVVALQMNFVIGLTRGNTIHEPLPTFALQVKDWFFEMLRFSTPFAYRPDFPDSLMSYDWVTWTLPLEYWASMSVWIVCMALCQFPRYAVRMSLLLLACLFSLQWGAWYFFCYLAGMTIADFHLESKTFRCEGTFFKVMTHPRRQVLYWCILIFGLYINGAPGMSELELWDLKVPGFIWMNALTPNWLANPFQWYLSWTGVLLVFSINRLPAVQRIFESCIPQALGECSFSFYLIHQVCHDLLVRNWLREAIVRWFNLDIQTTRGHNAWFFTMFVITTPVIFATSRGFQYLIDDNCVKLARELELWLRKPGKPSSTIADSLVSEQVLSTEKFPQPAELEDWIEEFRTSRAAA